MNSVVSVNLPASLQHDLDWSLEKATAEKIAASGKAILWEIDFQWNASSFLSSAAFLAYGRALEEFIKLSSAFAEQTFGVCLYRGSADFSFFEFSHWEDRFYEWIDELKLPDVNENAYPHYFHLFKADLFASYLHRLVSFLPDTMQSFAFFDVDGISSPAFCAQLFSSHRFEHVRVSFEEQDKRLPLALCLPSDPYCDRKILARLDAVIYDLKAKGIPFRIICEEKLTEEWDGLDRLIVIPEAESPQCKRKLQGFAAAGGEIIEN
jgi:hypothetical protein